MESWDVVVVGSGVAALRAAISALDTGATVCIIDDTGPGSAQARADNTGIAASLNESDFHAHYQDTIAVAKGLETTVSNSRCASSVNALIELERWGLNLRRDGAGAPALSSQPGHSTPRVATVGDVTGRETLRILEEQCMKRGIPRRHDIRPIQLVVENQRIRGLVILDIQDGDITPIQAKSVIIAGDGYDGLWMDSGSTGSKIALAYRAGAKLSGMEFIGWHPLGIKDSGITLSLSFLDAGARLRKANGEDVELVGGLTEACRLMGDDDYVLDARAVPISLRPWFSTSAQLISDRFGIDIWTSVIPVTPSPRYTIGGVAVDEEGRALIGDSLWLTGLYAAGASADSGMHGSDVLAGNWTLDSLLSGSSAGTSAADWTASVKHGGHPLLMEAAFEVETNIEAMSEVKEGMTVGALTASLRRTMNANMGLIRDSAGLITATTQIEKLMTSPIHLSDDSAIMNTELITVLDAGCMLDIAHAVVVAAESRKESRGSHHRSDYPELGDQNVPILISSDGMIL